MKAFKISLKIIAIVLAVIVLFAIGFVLYLTAVEYKPADIEDLEIVNSGKGETVKKEISVLTLNTGYGGLDKEQDFFMDGGKGVNPESKEKVESNVTALNGIISELDADIVLLQEVDSDSMRSKGIDEVGRYRDFNKNLTSSAYALNYSCPFVPFPLPPMGKINSGVLTLSSFEMSQAQRYSLPCPFSWPVRIANLKRCMLVSRIPYEGKEIVVINFHLEAYESGDGKIKQMNLITSFMEEEYKKGNYVIAGGDFNQTFPCTLEKYPIKDGAAWKPGTLDNSMLPDCLHFVYDDSSPSCRLLDAPLTENTQKYVLDGFIVSDNVKVESVETIDKNFEFTDHNPVKINITLGE